MWGAVLVESLFPQAFVVGAIITGFSAYNYGVFRYRRKEIGAAAAVLLMALAFDAVVLVAFTVMKLGSDPAIVAYALIGIAAVFGFERRYLSRWVAPAAD